MESCGICKQRSATKHCIFLALPDIVMQRVVRSAAKSIYLHRGEELRVSQNISRNIHQSSVSKHNHTDIFQIISQHLYQRINDSSYILEETVCTMKCSYFADWQFPCRTPVRLYIQVIFKSIDIAIFVFRSGNFAVFNILVLINPIIKLINNLINKVLI